MGAKQPERVTGKPLLLTYKEAARELGISLSTLYELLRSGAVRKLELGPQTMRIPLAECVAYAERLMAEQWGDSPAA